MRYRHKVGFSLFLILLLLSARADAAQTICTVSLTNSTGDANLNWVGYLMADSISNKLKALPQWNVITAPVLVGGPDEPALLMVGEQAGADAVIGGSYRKAAGEFAADILLLRVSDGEKIGGASFTSSLSELYSHINEVVPSLVRSVGVKYSESQEARMQLIPTASQEAMEAYGKALMYASTSPERYQLLQKALSFDPNYTDALSALGMYYYEKEKYTTAQETFGKLSRVQPDYPFVYYNLGLALKAGTLYDKAIEMYHKALEEEPANADAWNNIGVVHYLMGRYDEARGAFERALQIRPDQQYARLNLQRLTQKVRPIPAAPPLQATAKLKEYIESGAAFYASGDYTRAIENFEKALELEPNNFKANNNVALAYLKMGNVAVAKQHFEIALTVDPTAADVREALASLSGPAQAKVATDVAVESAVTAPIPPPQENPRTLIAAGKVHLMRKEYGKAEESFIRALELEPDNTDALHNLGLVYFARRDYEQAKRQFEEVLRLDPQNAEARKRLEDLSYIAQTTSQQPTFQLALPEQAEARAHVVQANELYQSGDYENAIAEYRRALDFAPTNVEILNNLGTAYSAIGKKKEAEAVLKKAREIAPENETVAQNLESVNLLDDSGNETMKSLFAIDEKTQKEKAAFASSILSGLAQDSKQQPAPPPVEEAAPARVAAITAGEKDALPALQNADVEIVPAPAIARGLTEKEASGKIPPERAEAETEIASVESSKAQFNLAVFKESEGDLEGALLHYREAVRLESGNAVAQYNLGNIYFRLGALESAIECYEAALKADGSLGQVYNNLGVAYYKLGKSQQATQAWQQALRVQPSLQSARENLSRYGDEPRN